MNPDSFRCLLVEQAAAETRTSVVWLPSKSLPEGDITIRVEYSSLNYKDALACQGHPGIVKELPHVPGIDAVGGPMLNSLLRSTKYGGCVAACGMVAGVELSMSVYPFLLRGITLCGLASAECPYEKRLRIWQLLANEWKAQANGDMGR